MGMRARELVSHSGVGAGTGPAGGAGAHGPGVLNTPMLATTGRTGAAHPS
jgi:hypothetical protein